MNARTKAALRRFGHFMLDRLRESATWRGVTLLLTVAGAQLTEEHKEAIVFIGLAISGAIGVFLPDRVEPREPSERQ